MDPSHFVFKQDSSLNTESLGSVSEVSSSKEDDSGLVNY